jgi:hypothetical protein
VDIDENRKVDVIVYGKGGKVKSTVLRYLGVMGKAKEITFANGLNDVLRMVMDMPTHKCNCIDMCMLRQVVQIFSEQQYERVVAWRRVRRADK